MKVRILSSIETSDGGRCVDLFIRPNGSYGFEVYRLDPETLTNWFPIGNYMNITYLSKKAALQAAANVAPWLDKP